MIDLIYQFLKPELVVLVPALNFVGTYLKDSEKVADYDIPKILTLISIILVALYTVATSVFVTYQDVLMGIFIVITQGIVCTGMSVYFNQILSVQPKKKESEGK